MANDFVRVQAEGHLSEDELVLGVTCITVMRTARRGRAKRATNAIPPLVFCHRGAAALRPPTRHFLHGPVRSRDTELLGCKLRSHSLALAATHPYPAATARCRFRPDPFSKNLDLPDCYAALAAKNLKLIETKGALSGL